MLRCKQTLTYNKKKDISHVTQIKDIQETYKYSKTKNNGMDKKGDNFSSDLNTKHNIHRESDHTHTFLQIFAGTTQQLLNRLCGHCYVY